MKKKILAVALAAMTIAPMASCGQVVDEFDSNKTQIYVKVWNGGFGIAWAESLRDQFNAQNDKYEIVLRPKKDSATDIITDVQSGSPDGDIYFNAGTDFQEGIYKDLFEDLSDVLTMEPDGAGTGTVQSKMTVYDTWKGVSSKYGEGMYMLPWNESLVGMVFDYKLFVDNGWLTYADATDKTALSAQGITFTEENGTLKFASATGKVNYQVGDIILKAGKDGTFGTYDDGQPQTIAEFEEMLNVITLGNKKAKSFIYSGQYDIYLSYVMQAIMAQYMGTELYEAYFTYNSGAKEMPMHDGTSKAITLENGYEVFKSEGVYQGLNFIDTYYNASTVDENVKKTTSFSHTDAQNNFLLGYKKSTGFPAMLVEGGWWENEAREMFNNIAKEDSSRGFGKREYRFLMTPAMEGQAFEANKTAVETAENGVIIVPKQKDKDKLAKIKEFILLSLQEKNLKEFTLLSGGFRPYKYDFTQEELAKATPFVRNSWAIYNDTKNVELIRTKHFKFADPMIMTSGITIYTVPIKSGATYTGTPIRYLRENKLDNLFTSSNLGYSSSDWDTFVGLARAEGFFND